MLLGEDLLLVLLDPAGRTLGRVRAPLAGALVWDLERAGVLRWDENATAPSFVAPSADLDPLLRAAADRLAARPPREKSDTVRTLVDLAGPALRDRLAQRGLVVDAPDGPISVDPAYRASVVAYLQAVLAGQAPTDPRSAALITLVAMTGGISRLTARVDWRRVDAVRESSWVMKATQFVTGKPGSPDRLAFWNT